jgi:hypothetical protein
VTFPRYTAGSVIGLNADDLNQAIDAVKRVQNTPTPKRPLPRRDKNAFVARVTGLTDSATQGRAQQNSSATAYGQRRSAFFYKWEEISLGVADFESTPGTGSAVRDTVASEVTDAPTATGEKTVSSAIERLPAVDFCPVQRFMVGDLVMLHGIIVRSNSKYMRMFAMTLLEPQHFLARLTAQHPTIDGIYSWTGLTTATGLTGNTVQPAGTIALERAAVNLYELNGIPRANSYTTGLTISSTSYVGSNNWGHGQSLTGAGATVTKLKLPVGDAGTGTIVMMHRLLHDAATSSADTSANFCFYAVPPVSAACDP